MSHVLQNLRLKVIECLVQLQDKDVLPEDIDFSKVTVDAPRDNGHGDITTNAAMVLSKTAGLSAKDLACQLQDQIRQLDVVTDCQIAGPGFINITLNAYFWHQSLKHLLESGTNYGSVRLSDGQNLNLEYVSTNPTGPLHIGHCRIAVVGDVLANILAKVGYNVVREYYINDAGGQVDTLARSAHTRYLQALGHDVQSFGGYGGDYLVPVGQALAQKYQQTYVDAPESIWLEIFKADAVSMMMARIRQDLVNLNIYQDVFTSEKALVSARKVQEVYDLFEQQNLIYNGILSAPKGMVVEDYEERPQNLFRSTAFGDDVDRPLKKSDGSWTYFASDIAYHWDKYQRGAQNMVVILGSDHSGYVPRLKAAVKALTNDSVPITIKLCQMVKFTENGQVLKMSKRAGTFLTVQDAVAKVGRDAMRFMMVWRKSDMSLEFDFEKVIDHSRDNPVFYVQYAYARCHSVYRHALKIFPQLDITHFTNTEIQSLTTDIELELVKKLAFWPRVVESAALMYEPHRIAYYLYEVAGLFHALWNRGKDNLELRFVDCDHLGNTRTKLCLIQAVMIVLRSGFALLGIDAKQELRDETL